MTVYSAAPVLFESVSGVTATMGANDAEIGSRIRLGDEEYIKVYNTGASAINVGYAATVSGVSNYSVTVSSVVTNGDIAIGVCKHTVISASCYGWLMTQGFAPGATGANESMSTGVLATLGTDGVLTAKSISTGFMGNVYAKVMSTLNSGSSAGTGTVFYNIL